MKEIIRKFVFKTFDTDWDTHWIFVDLEIEDSERNEQFSLKGEIELDLAEETIYPVNVEMSTWNTADHITINASFSPNDALYSEVKYDEDLEETITLKEFQSTEAREQIFSSLNENLKWIFKMYFPYGERCHC